MAYILLFLCEKVKKEGRLHRLLRPLVRHGRGVQAGIAAQQGHGFPHQLSAPHGRFQFNLMRCSAGVLEAPLLQPIVDLACRLYERRAPSGSG
jgi:hypothetical protein